MRLFDAGRSCGAAASGVSTREAAIGEIVKPPVSASEARLSGVLDMAGDGILVLDARGTVLVFNRACESLFGWLARDIVGRNAGLLIDGVAPDTGADSLRSLLGTGREVTARHHDGRTFPVEMSLSEAETFDGPQFIGILRDLRPRKEAEERFGQLQAELMQLARVSAMDQMGAALAHELNQPLTALTLYLQAAGRMQARAVEPLAPDATGAGPGLRCTLDEVIGKALREAGRAGQIIQAMRHFIEKGSPERRPEALNPLVEEAIELTLLGQRGGTRIARRLARGLPPVHVEAVQIQQVVVNLLRNALEALEGRPDGRIVVETQAQPETIALTVRDNGSGIPPAAMDGLFRPFSSSKPAGLGLGLAISRTIARNHGGDLTVDPGGQGRGAAFTLLLPRHPPAASPKPKS